MDGGGDGGGMVSGWFKHITFLVSFISNLTLLLICLEGPVCGPEVGDPCSKCLRWWLHRIQLSTLWLLCSHLMRICWNWEIRLEFVGSKMTSQTHSHDAWIPPCSPEATPCFPLGSSPSRCSSSFPFFLYKTKIAVDNPQKPRRLDRGWQARGGKGWGGCHGAANGSLSWIGTERPLNEHVVPCPLPSHGLLMLAGKVHTKDFRTGKDSGKFTRNKKPCVWRWWWCWVTKSCPTLATPWPAALQAPLSMAFPRQDYWSGLPFASPGHLPSPRTEPTSPGWRADSTLGHLGSPRVWRNIASSRLSAPAAEVVRGGPQPRWGFLVDTV